MESERRSDYETKDDLQGGREQDDSVSRTPSDVVTKRHNSSVAGTHTAEAGNSSSGEHADTRELESVLEYTNRIKSFLGWDNPSEPEFLEDKPDKDTDSEADIKSNGRNQAPDEDNFNADSRKNTEVADNEINDKLSGDLNSVSELDTDDVELLRKSEKNKGVDSNILSDVTLENYPPKQEGSGEENSEPEDQQDSLNTQKFGEDCESEKFSSFSKDLLDANMNENLIQADKTVGNGVLLFPSQDILLDEGKCDTLPGEGKIINKKDGEKHYMNHDTNVKANDDIQGVVDCEVSNLEIPYGKSVEEQHIAPKISEKFPESENDKPNSTNSQVEVVEEQDMKEIRDVSESVVNDVLSTAQTQIQEIFNKRASTDSPTELVDNWENACKDTAKELESVNLENASDNFLQKSNCSDYTDHTLKSETNFNKEIPNLSDNTKKKIENEPQKDEYYDLDEDTVCGMGSFRPRWIQPWATAKSYLILYSIIGVLQGSYYTYLIGSLSTLEKRFAFKSKISGVIMTVDEITPLFLGVLIGYFGGKAHRPRMVAIGMLLSASCCFISALPYFIYGPATHLTSLSVQNKTGPELCDSDVKEEACAVDERPPTLAAILFLMLGSFLKGFGNLAYYTIGLAYMDDNAEKKNTPIYFAVAFALRLLGPLVGFLMSSAFLKFYENPFDDPGFGPDDPRWIGGWWMGFMLQGVLLVIFTLPISMFPRRLPGHSIPQAKQDYSEGEGLSAKFKGLFTALKRLAKNPLFVCLVVNTITAIFGSFGHYIMLPKYMENQFRLTASDASLFSGPPGLTAVMVATVFGGFLIWKYRPNAKLLITGMVLTEVISASGYLLLMIPRCQKVEMSNLGFDDEGLILGNQCNLNCNCTTMTFTPVCGPDGQTTYFSPCYAGCSHKHESMFESKKRQVFENCSCVIDHSKEQSKTATEGFCVVENCWSQALAYIITLPILQAVTSILRVSHTMILLRSIHPEDKSVALGTFETLICLFGFIPYPMTFGALVDSACLIWEKSCGKTGNCWFYDVEKFNYLLHGASAFFCSLTALSLFCIYFMHQRVRNLYEDEEDELDVNEKKIEVIRLDTVTSSVTKL